MASVRNRELDLTGIMIVASRFFAQYLEGPSAAVARVMASIRRDVRHTSLFQWDPAQLEQRRFPSWRMVFFGPSEDIDRAVDPILAHLNGTLPDAQRIKLIQLMEALSRSSDALPIQN